MRPVTTSLYAFLLAVCGISNGGEADRLSNVRSGERHRPVIAFDSGHNNWGDQENFSVMKNFLSENGFEVTQLAERIGREALRHIDVYHTSNALAPINIENWALPTPSAFTPMEIGTLFEWVCEGGALFLAIEHMPFPGAYNALAAALGITLSNGFVVDKTKLHGFSMDAISAAGTLQFSRERNSLARHPLLDGPNPFKRVEYLSTDTGSAFQLPEHAISLTSLGANIVSLEPETSWKFNDATPQRDVTGWTQIGILEVGKGRVVVVGDNFLVSAPAFLEPPYVESQQEAELGAYNHQFTLNAYRWLTRQ